jgi:hypothetical protein
MADVLSAERPLITGRGRGRRRDIVVDWDQALVRPVKQSDQLGIVPSRT